MCYSPITIKVEGKYDVNSHYVQVPCGHCLECLKQKQNELVARMNEEYKASGYKAVFITLTYRNNTVPKNYLYKGKIYKSAPHYAYTNREEWTGKRGGRLIFPEKPYQCLAVHGIPVDNIVPFQWEDGLKNKQYSASVETALMNDYPIEFDSVRREDVKFAIDWFRKYKHDKVRVFLASEYGTKTERPHYHALFFGEDMDTLRPFINFWRKHFGIVDASMCEGLGALTYVGKYSSKGCFGNVFCSKDFFYTHSDGRHTEYHSKDYEKCIEFFGINEPIVDTCFRVIPKGFGASYLTPEKVEYHLGKHDIDEIIKNKKYILPNGKKTVLPKYYCEKIFNRYLTNKISRAVQKGSDYNFESEYELLESNNPDWTDYEVLCETLKMEAEKNEYKRRQATAFDILNDKFKKDNF